MVFWPFNFCGFFLLLRVSFCCCCRCCWCGNIIITGTILFCTYMYTIYTIFKNKYGFTFTSCHCYSCCLVFFFWSHRTCTCSFFVCQFVHSTKSTTIGCACVRTCWNDVKKECVCVCMYPINTHWLQIKTCFKYALWRVQETMPA